ncbi:MAG: hypothetical protein HC849_34130 [Oscillatoriales cyanobacterium RU_3_3]|nr:hypothetical protein [Oscillatoriales cyanobacterium RU_3_3]
MNMPGRSFSSGGYRYGFNGKEQDPEVRGTGTQYDYGFRIYDTRLGRFLSVDPLFQSYPWYTTYQFAGNTPIQAIDIDGLEEYVVTNYYNRFNQLEQTTITFINAKELNQVVNMQLVTSSGQKISPNHKVLVRNISSKGQLSSYGRKQTLNKKRVGCFK